MAHLIATQPHSVGNYTPLRQVMASYEIDAELGQLGDMPLYDNESKYFLADFHEVNTLPYVDAKARIHSQGAMAAV